LINQTVWPQYTNVTDKQTEQTGQWSHIIGRTVLQTVAQEELECGLMPNVMAALPNIGGALFSTPQISADAHYSSAVK